MSIKQAIEQYLEKIEQLTEHGPREYARAALAALRSMPAEPVDDALNTLCKMMHSGEEVEGDDGLAMLVPMDLWNEAQEAIELLVGEDDATPQTEAVRMSEAWQPIDTAPKDGTPVLAWNREYGARETQSITYGPGSPGHAQGLTNRWWQWDEPKNNWTLRWDPTHWKPLPPPPVEQATAARLGVTLGDV